MWLKQKTSDLPTDYQTGSCHGKKKDDEGEHMGRVEKSWKSNYNGEKRQQNVNLNRYLRKIDTFSPNHNSQQK